MSGDEGGGSRPDGDRWSARLARFFRQRAELAGDELFLERLGRDEALGLIDDFAAGGRSPGATSGAPETSPGPTAGAEREASTRGSSGAAAAGEDALSPAERAVQEGTRGEETVQSFDYGTLEKVALGCERCRLAEERTQVVFSDGNPDGRLMVVGEAPGSREDATGLPFVGPAGKLLDLLLAGVDLSREDTAYICNVIKCRPPGNRNPLPDEIEACAPYLRRQIELVRPQAILAVGTFAGQLLTGRSSTLGKLRGEVYSYEGVPLVVTYHPAALLRNRSWTRSTWDDLQLLRQVLDGG